MAGRIGVVTVKGVTLDAATEETLLQLVAAANHPIKILEFGVGFFGTTNTNPAVEVDLYRQSTAGTASANTPKNHSDEDSGSFDTTAQDTFTAEPTKGAHLKPLPVHPQTTGSYQATEKAAIRVGGGNRVGLIAKASAAVTCDAWIVFEE